MIGIIGLVAFVVIAWLVLSVFEKSGSWIMLLLALAALVCLFIGSRAVFRAWPYWSTSARWMFVVVVAMIWLSNAIEYGFKALAKAYQEQATATEQVASSLREISRSIR